MRPLPLAMLIGCGAVDPADCPPCPAPQPCDEVGLDNLEMAIPDGKQLSRPAAELEWGSCPPGPLAEADCQMAVLEGSPKAVDQLFTLRIKVGEPLFMTPHTHRANERVTVLEGEVIVGFGVDVDKAVGTTFGPGDFYINAADQVHWVRTPGPAIVQITGLGPWTTDPATP